MKSKFWRIYLVYVAVILALLGRVSKYFDFPEEAWQEAVEACVPPRFLALNRAAFALGREA